MLDLREQATRAQCSQDHRQRVAVRDEWTNAIGNAIVQTK
jgi:hypothetical protein